MAIGAKRILPFLVFMGAGCATLEETAYAPTYRQLSAESPQLLNCPAGTMAACEHNGSRIRPRLERCGCVRAR
jgi:hypothetical protein